MVQSNSTRWGKTVRNCREKIKDLNKKKQNLILGPEMNAMNLAVMTGFNFQVNLQSTRDLIMIVEKMHKKHE